MSEVKLTQMVKTSGCAAKLPVADLNEVLNSLPTMSSVDLVGGFEGNDDAFVYKLPKEKDMVMLQTVDFFPPMVDDPFTFGQVAAANALSDIYAMGAEPKVALNIVSFPTCLELSVLKEILLGGQDKVKEANAIIAGGHTISDATPKYGLSVTGFAHKDKVWTNSKAQVGDLLILTKPLGVGIINTAVKAQMATKECADAAIKSMIQLNKEARDVAVNYLVNAATDITGFSLVGHSVEMALASKVTLKINVSKLPLFDNVLEYAKMGLNPGGLYSNKEYLENKVEIATSQNQELIDVLYDPQTSGGLLLSMSEKEANAYSKETGFPIIGSVTEAKSLPLVVES